MIRKINAFFTHKAITVKGAKNYTTAHDLEGSQLTQLFTQLLSWSLWCVAWDAGYPTSSPKQSVELKLKKSVKRGVKESYARDGRVRRVFFIIIFSDLLFDCSPVLEYAKIRPVLQTSPKRRACAQATLWEREWHNGLLTHSPRVRRKKGWSVEQGEKSAGEWGYDLALWIHLLFWRILKSNSCLFPWNGGIIVV